MATAADSLAEKMPRIAWYGRASNRCPRIPADTVRYRNVLFCDAFPRTDSVVVSTDPDRFRHVRDKIRHANHCAWELSGLTCEHALIPGTQ